MVVNVADCTILFGIEKSIAGLKLTRNISKDDKYRMELVEFGERKQILRYLYDFENNKGY